MLWAALVASGVAVVSMTVFATWITRRGSLEQPEEEFMPSADPDDPWSAYRPRPFEEVEERPRPRLWPLVTALTGLVLVGGGIAGARQSMQLDALPAEPSTRPYVVDVKTPTPPPTPSPTPVPTRAPVVAAAAAPRAQVTKPVAKAPVSSGSPTITSTTSCSGGMLKVNFQISGTNLSWFGLYVDKKVVKGGSMSGGSYSSSYSASATPGDHEVEISAETKDGKSARKLYQVHCA